ncbi:hypothetical protein FQN57_000833 [Myotisia sp. PD_48]|nr:hypothetical protein FQN57_000833 [Myotisia sp. PD_48]
MLCLRCLRRSIPHIQSLRHPNLSSIFVRRKTLDALSSSPRAVKRPSASSSQGALRAPLRHPQSRIGPAAGRARLRPKQVVIYHAGTGKIAFIGMMRATTILIFVVSCAVVAPAFSTTEFPWYLSPAIIIGGAIPMLFVTYTAAPFVNQIFLSLPSFVQHSAEHTQSFLKKVPRTATLSIETMRFNFYPKRTVVSIGDLAPRTSILRPVTFMNTNPQLQPWWKGKDKVYFYTPERSRPAKPTSKFYPGVWEQVFSLIKSNKA